jgi:hypothetical protein
VPAGMRGAVRRRGAQVAAERRGSWDLEAQRKAVGGVAVRGGVEAAAAAMAPACRDASLRLRGDGNEFDFGARGARIRRSGETVGLGCQAAPRWAQSNSKSKRVEMEIGMHSIGSRIVDFVWTV